MSPNETALYRSYLMSLIRRPYLTTLLGAAMLFGASACSDSASPHAPAAISVETGDNATVGVNAATKLEVMISDAEGNPVAGVTIAWSILSGDGTLSTTTSVTEDDGCAAVMYTAGSASATAAVLATAGKLDVFLKVFVVQ
jgi:hypothetical protein